MFKQIGDCNIHYEIYGEGLPVFAIHGFYPDLRLMKGCLEPVLKGKKYKRIYFDVPGMGKTETGKQIDNADQMFSILLDFKNALIGDSTYIIAGESYGGYLSRQFIKQDAANIAGALFICPCTEPIASKRSVPEHVVLQEEKSLREKHDAAVMKEYETIAVIQDEYTFDRFDKEIYSGLQLADSNFLEKYRSQGYAFSENVDRLTGPFSKPALFVLGKQDQFVGYHDAYTILKNYPRASFCILDEAGHNLQIEKSAIFDTMVGDLLERIERNERKKSDE